MHSFFSVGMKPYQLPISSYLHFEATPSSKVSPITDCIEKENTSMSFIQKDLHLFRVIP